MDCGSFTLAADALHMTQPGISKLISLLETDCGFALFSRSGRGVTPTAEAHLLFDEVRRVFQDIRSIETRAAVIRRFGAGELRIAAFPSLGSRILPRILSPFLAQHQVRVDIASRNSCAMLDLVSAQAVDLGFGMVREDRPNMTCRRLATMEAVCVLPPGHRLTGQAEIGPADLVGERLIVLSDEDRADLAIEQAFARAGVERHIVARTQLSEACCALVAAGAGAAIVDPLSAAAFVRDGIHIARFTPRVSQTIWALLPSLRPPSRLARMLLSHVERTLPAVT